MSNTWVVGHNFANGNGNLKNIPGLPATVLKLRVLGYFHGERFYGICPDSAAKGKVKFLIYAGIEHLPKPFPIENETTMMLMDLFVDKHEQISLLMPLSACFSFDHDSDLEPENLKNEAYILTSTVDSKYALADINEPKDMTITILNGDLVVKG